jgi:hypothetical protein
MLMMRVRTLKLLIARVWLRIIPAKLLLSFPDFIAIPINDYWLTMEQ